MTLLLLALIAATLLITLWMSVLLNRVRAKVEAVPEDGNVYEFLRSVDNDVARVQATVTDLAPRLAHLEQRVPHAVSHTGVVAYDAFGDISGNQSRSIALLNDKGDGFVLSILVGRDETRFFTKQVSGGAGAEPLSPEEESAVARAMGR